MKTEKIIIAGFGGQGSIALGYLLAGAGMYDDLHVSHFPSYGAEMRGGTANCSVIISSEEITSPVMEKATSAIIMNDPSLAKFESRIQPKGLLLLNTDVVQTRPVRKDLTVVSLQANQMAEQSGNLMGANIFMGGVYIALTKIATPDSFRRAIKELFKKKSQKIIDSNIQIFDTALKYKA
ncbi:MAG: 2-oxoacid:acceptor oxidoreductase family protein [Spirochaetes bacterium]|nr:2-oxoacid:acceptor oxidoreductase family protein [Spirochaetota bacterium]